MTIVYIILLLLAPSLWQQSNSFKDTRDGKSYKTVKIESQIWMAENLNFDAGKESECWDDNLDNCNKFGRLYTWEVAKKAVPPGWHLPSEMEFEQLLNYLGPDAKIAYEKLIQGGSSGFNVVFGGLGTSHGSYDLGSDAYLWSSTEHDITTAWNLSVHPNHADLNSLNYKVLAMSVRCIQN